MDSNLRDIIMGATNKLYNQLYNNLVKFVFGYATMQVATMKQRRGFYRSLFLCSFSFCGKNCRSDCLIVDVHTTRDSCL